MLIINFNPFPVLQTERLHLRRMTLADANEIFFLRSDDSVIKYLNKPAAKTIDEAKDFISGIELLINTNQSVMWAICLKERPGLIGTVCLWNFRKENYRAELGYTLHPQYWRKGIAKEAAVKAIDYGFKDLKLHSIDAVIDPQNENSAFLLNSLGFVKEAHYKEDVFFNGKFSDTAVYSLLSPLPHTAPVKKQL